MPQRKKMRSMPKQKEFEFFPFTAKNKVFLTDAQAKAAEEKIRLLGMASLTPEKLYSDPTLRARFFSSVPKDQRMDALRGILKGRIGYAVANSKRVKLPQAFMRDEKSRNMLLEQINSLSEEQLAKAILQSQKLTGGKFDSFVLNLLKK